MDKDLGSSYSCFSCRVTVTYDNTTNFKLYGKYYPYGLKYNEYLLNRQNWEAFKTTHQRRRIICRNVFQKRLCRLRVDRMMMIRGEAYTPTNKFYQNENHLNDEDVNII